MEVAEARALARRLLSNDLPQRWQHVQGVAAQAELFVDRIANWDLLACAAYLHDIGYAADIVEVGFHQIDGARHLRRLGWDEAVVNLVAHHSDARLRAELAGLDGIYDAEFVRDESLPHRELHFCDLTVSLDGSPIAVEDRLANMRRRHPDNPLMERYLTSREHALTALVAETWAALGQAEVGDPAERTASVV